ARLGEVREPALEGGRRLGRLAGEVEELAEITQPLGAEARLGREGHGLAEPLRRAGIARRRLRSAELDEERGALLGRRRLAKRAPQELGRGAGGAGGERRAGGFPQALHGPAGRPAP